MLYCQNVLKVEHSLLPVGILGVRARREADRLVACREVDIEPSDKGMDEIVTSAGKFEGNRKSKIVHGAFIQIKGQDSNRVSDSSLDLDIVNERLGKSSLLERGIVESVDIIPN